MRLNPNVLTDKQRQVLDLICESFDRTGQTPTYTELAKVLNISYISVRDRVLWLEKKGYVALDLSKRKGRAAIRILQRCPEPKKKRANLNVLEQKTVPTTAAQNTLPLPQGGMRVVQIPLLGTVVAGNPFAAEEVMEGMVFIDSSIPHAEECYAVRVCGESMKDAGFHSGDVLLVHPQQLANHGDIVIASVNGDLTVKTLSFDDGQVSLLPANPEFHPISISPNDDFKVMGVVMNQRPSFVNPQAE